MAEQHHKSGEVCQPGHTATAYRMLPTGVGGVLEATEAFGFCCPACRVAFIAARSDDSWNVLDEPRDSLSFHADHTCDQCGHSLAPRAYQILAVQFVPEHREQIRAYRARSIGEALTMAERDDAGQAEWIYGVRPEDYDAARREGIAFNEADGLLV